MTVYWISKTKKLIFPLLFIVSIISCKKDLGTVGADFIGVRSGFQTVLDTTIEINAYTVKMDSIATHRLSRNVIGNFYDPDLGVTQATIVHQVTMPTTSQFTWSGASKLDSVILRLRLSSDDSYFGDKNLVRTFKVYQLDEDITYDSIYHSDRAPKIKNIGTPVGSYTGIVNVKDTTTAVLGSKTLSFPPHVRIPMNQVFTDLLYGAELRGELSSITEFKKAFKGFVIVDETDDAVGKGAMFYVNMRSLNSALYAYFDTSFAEFAMFQGSEAIYNNFKHTLRPPGLLQTPFTGVHKNINYLQPMAGTKMRVELPNILSLLSNQNIAINGAEIKFFVQDGSTTSPYVLPKNLLLTASDSLGRNIFLRDNFFEPQSYYGGDLNTYSNSYSFNIVRHLQYILSEYKHNNDFNYGLNLIIPSDFPLTASRVILNTDKNNGKIKLKLTYTVVK